MRRATKNNRVVRMRARATWAYPMLAVMLLLLPTMAPVCLTETEPNDTTGEANLIRPGEFGRGNITPIGDADFWRAEGAGVGDLVFAYVDTQGADASSDSFLEVFANDGTTLIEDDDQDGPGLGSVVAGAIVPQAGNVFLRVTEDGDDATITDADLTQNGYEIYQAIVDPANTAAELEGNDTSATANGIPAVIMTGTISNGGSDDFFKFRAVSGSSLVVIMDDNPDDNGDGTNLNTDTDLHILDTDGSSVLATGDNVGTFDGNAVGAVTAPSTGTFFVRVDDDAGTDDTEYRFVLLINGVPYVDTDEDLFADTDDNCPAINNAAQLDGDGDGVGDSCDNCVASILKSAGPGDCGCGQPDVDIDGDGVSDCGLADPALSLLSSFGLLLVPDTDNNRIMAFDPADGDLVDPDFIPSDAANLPNPVAAILGPNQDTVLVSDRSDDVVQQYDLNGNYLGIFAPAGGVDNTILDSPGGLAWRPNGNLVVCVQSGANADAVAEFDASGNFVGNFIAPGAGGLSGPSDILFHTNGNVLVSDATGTIRQYDAAGTFIADFATNPGSLILQLAEASDTNAYAAATSGARRGILDFLANGTLVNQHAPFSICNFNGLAELSNGNWLITGQPLITGGTAEGSAFEMDTAGNVVRTTLRGPALGFVERVLRDADGDGVGDALDGCPNDAAKLAPGACGCGTPDIDTDGDGVANCNDPCPGDNPDDSDGDGVCDSVDACPGADDNLDANGNGTPDCLEAPPPPPPAGQPTEDCCGGGMPMMMPLMLMGWKWGRRRNTRRRSSRRSNR